MAPQDDAAPIASSPSKIDLRVHDGSAGRRVSGGGRRPPRATSPDSPAPRAAGAAPAPASHPTEGGGASQRAGSPQKGLQGDGSGVWRRRGAGGEAHLVRPTANGEVVLSRPVPRSQSRGSTLSALLQARAGGGAGAEAEQRPQTLGLPSRHLTRTCILRCPMSPGAGPDRAAAGTALAQQQALQRRATHGPPCHRTPSMSQLSAHRCRGSSIPKSTATEDLAHTLVLRRSPVVEVDGAGVPLSAREAPATAAALAVVAAAVAAVAVAEQAEACGCSGSPSSGGGPDPPCSPRRAMLRFPSFLRGFSDGSTGSVSLSDLEAACTPAQSPSSTFGHSSSWESGLADEAGRSPVPQSDTPEPDELPSLRQSQLASFRRRLATAASFAGKVSSALDEEDLAVPWRETEKLTKLNSAMLRMGLQYGIAGGGDPGTLLTAPACPLGPRSTAGWPGSPTGTDNGATENAANAHQRAALRQELHRLQELQDRIERRDRRRECAKQHAEDQQRREALGLRAAMWLTIIKVHAHSVAARLAKVLHSQQLTQCILPIWRLMVFRNKRRRARQRLLQQVAPHTERLTPAQLRGTGPLFQDWPEELLGAFTGEMQLCPFAEGEYICHQGDPSGLLYVLVAGTVDVVLRRPDSAGKARGKRAGMAVACLSPVRYVGEYGVFAGEPRAATLYCASQVVAWAASKECLVRYLKQVPVPVYCGICTTFESSMATIYKVRPVQLASTALFQGWDLPTLEQVVARLQPVFFPEDAVILKAGSPGTAVFIVAKGRCHTVRDGATEEQTAGALLGLRSCVFLEPHQHEVRACTTVQAWQLPKATLMDFLLLRPDRFLAAKRRLNADVAKALAKPPLEHLLAGSSLAQLPLHVQQLLYSKLEPFVAAAMDPVVHLGDAVEHLTFLLSGQCTVNGAPLPRDVLRCLGAEQLRQRVPCWPHTVVAQERAAGWRLPLGALRGVLEAQKGGPHSRPTKSLLVDVNHLRSLQAKLFPPSPS
eukprot:EG_transcript_1307